MMLDEDQLVTLKAMHVEWPGCKKHWDGENTVTFVIRRVHLMATFEVVAVDGELVVESELHNFVTDQTINNPEWMYSMSEHGLEGCVGLAVASIESCLHIWMR